MKNVGGMGGEKKCDGADKQHCTNCKSPIYRLNLILCKIITIEGTVGKYCDVSRLTLSQDSSITLQKVQCVRFWSFLALFKLLHIDIFNL